MTTTVREVLRRKGHDVYAISKDATVFAALEAMAEHDVGALLVFDGGRLVGMISERDYARKVVLMGHASKNLPVHRIMTPEPLCVAPELTVEQCMAIMTARRARHLPVIQSGRVIGLVSIGDVVKSIIEEQRFEIGELEHYIQGSAWTLRL